MYHTTLTQHVVMCSLCKLRHYYALSNSVTTTLGHALAVHLLQHRLKSSKQFEAHSFRQFDCMLAKAGLYSLLQSNHCAVAD